MTMTITVLKDMSVLASQIFNNNEIFAYYYNQILI